MPVVEVCVDNLESVKNAVAGGADRIELCSRLDLGGLTPTIEFLKETLAAINNSVGKSICTVFPMIRCRGGNFVYTKAEYEEMAQSIKDMRGCVQGFVFGGLKEDKTLDIEGMKLLLAAADGMPCTLHRAIDESKDLIESVKEAGKLGFTRILTSGGANKAIEGIEPLRKMTYAAKESNIIIMPGSGINKDNAKKILKELNCTEIHGSFSINGITQTNDIAIVKKF